MIIGDLKRETTSYALSLAFGGLVQLAFLPFISRFLNASETGELGILVTASGVMAALITIGLPTALIRTWQKTTAHRALMRRGLFIPLIPAAVILAVTVIFPDFLMSLMKLDNREILIHAVFLAISAAFVLLSFSFIRADGRSRLYLILSIVRGVLMLLLLGFFLYTGRSGIRAFLTARWIPSAAVALFAAFYMFLKIRNIEQKEDTRGLTGNILGFGLPLLPASLALLVLSSADMFMLRHLYPDPSASGYYYWASIACLTLTPLIAGFEMGWHRFIFRLKRTGGNMGELGRAAMLFLVLVVWAAWMIGLLAPELVFLIGGFKFNQVSSILPTLAGATAMYAVFLVSQTGPLLTGQTRFIAGMTFFGALLNIGFNYRLIPVAGALGAAFATLATNLFMALSLFWLGRKVVPISAFSIIIIVIPLIALGPLSHLDSVVRSLLVLASSFVTGAVIFLLRSVSSPVKTELEKSD